MRTARAGCLTLLITMVLCSFFLSAGGCGRTAQSPEDVARTFAESVLEGDVEGVATATGQRATEATVTKAREQLFGTATPVAGATIDLDTGDVQSDVALFGVLGYSVEGGYHALEIPGDFVLERIGRRWRVVEILPTEE